MLQNDSTKMSESYGFYLHERFRIVLNPTLTYIIHYSIKNISKWKTTLSIMVFKNGKHTGDSIHSFEGGLAARAQSHR